VLRSEKFYGMAEEETDAIKRVLSDSYRYVFPKRTTEMAESAVKVPSKLAPFLSLPAKWCWIEFVEPVEGVLLNGSEDLKRANAIYVYKYREGAGDMVAVANAPLDLERGGFQLERNPEAIPERFQRRFMGAITLLGAPDLLERKVVQHSRKWNEARALAGKPVALDHDVIQLHLSRYEKAQERQWTEQQRDSTGGTGTRRRHHFVRAHIRITNRGKVSKVSPHYRGDPALGEAPHTHIVRP
jgi:hypothetical protein